MVFEYVCVKQWLGDVCFWAVNTRVLTLLGAVAEGAPRTSCKDTERVET